MMTLTLRPARDDFMTLAAFCIALTLLFAVGTLTDPRMLDGVIVWEKPLHFTMSFAMFFGSLALVVPRLSTPWRHGRIMRATATVMTAAFVFEMTYIAAQAAQAQRSHFNVGDPFHALMYALMGVGAVTLVAGVAVVGAVVARDADATMGPRTRQGVALGFILTMPLTLIVAGVLSGNGGHFVGTPLPGGGTVPLMGWSLTTGDLRPAHFVSIHTMQALPLLGLWLDRRANKNRRILWGAAVLWSLLCLALFVQALAGLPVLAV